MKVTVKTFVILLLPAVFIIGTAFAMAAEVSRFVAAFAGTDVRLEWQVEDESNIAAFEVWRKKADESSYTRINIVNTNGSGSYYLLDDGLYKNAATAEKPAQANALSYRLALKLQNGTTGQSYFVTVSQGPSAVQRSWGSIKAMFK